MDEPLKNGHAFRGLYAAPRLQRYLRAEWWKVTVAKGKCCISFDGQSVPRRSAVAIFFTRSQALPGLLTRSQALPWNALLPRLRLDSAGRACKAVGSKAEPGNQ